jgi:hypothetical protein
VCRPCRRGWRVLRAGPFWTMSARIWRPLVFARSFCAPAITAKISSAIRAPRLVAGYRGLFRRPQPPRWSGRQRWCVRARLQMVIADSCGAARDVLRTPGSARPDWERLFGFLPAHRSSILACQTTRARKRKFPEVGTCLVAYALKQPDAAEFCRGRHRRECVSGARGRVRSECGCCLFRTLFARKEADLASRGKTTARIQPVRYL